MNSVTSNRARPVLVVTVSALIASLALLVAFVQPATAQEYTVDEGTLENTSGGTLEAGEYIVISGGGFEPGSTVRITMESGAVLLAVVTADAKGYISARVQVPTDTPAGVHTLKATGSAPGGGVLVLSQSVTVSSTTGGTSSDGSTTDGTAGAIGSHSAELPATGVPATVMVVASVLLLVAGVVLVARRSRV